MCVFAKKVKVVLEDEEEKMKKRSSNGWPNLESFSALRMK